MEREHDTAGALLARLRELTAGYTPLADGCTSYEMLYRGRADLSTRDDVDRLVRSLNRDAGSNVSPSDGRVARAAGWVRPTRRR